MTLSASAAALAAFNLICTGTLTSNMGVRPSATTYRVDLDLRRYCFDDCTETHPIRAVTDREIIFHDAQYPNGNKHRRVVNRESGRMFDHVVLGKIEMTTDAICKSAPFT